MSTPVDLPDFPRHYLSSVCLSMLEGGVARDSVVDVVKASAATESGNVNFPKSRHAELVFRLINMAAQSLHEAGYRDVDADLRWVAERVEAMAAQTLASDAH